ncbi:DUF2497 domain-containing protein [uncultured Hyphomicrobium sp.]|uniref:DUF2497 domain-containing protein n=1 Tax=uncultured Hyphomicrobium sp. TaxID=194373 RepID=UPI0025F5C900|nr:DUF2497 domain-containing protein [uncultured Hyphomicrobium sp.]
MNRPDKAGEPSMEEILASIRQIIADGPSADQPEPAIEANPLVPQSYASSKPADAPVPLADRLSGVLKGGQLTPTSPLGSKRPLSFDQDLADMFDEQDTPNGNAVAAPKPDMRVPAGLSHPMAAKSFVSQKPESAKPAAVDEAAVLPPHFAPSEPLIPPPPFGGADKPAEAPPPPKAFGFPPLRKASFYPPQSAAPAVAPAPAQADALPVSRAADLDATSPNSAGERSSATTPAHVEEALKRLEGFGSPAAVPASTTGEAERAPIASPVENSPQASSPANGLGSHAEPAAPSFAFGGDPARRDPPRSFIPSSPFPPSSGFAASPVSPTPAAAPSAQPVLDSAPPITQPYTAPPKPLGDVDNRTVEAPRGPTFETRPVEPRPVDVKPAESRMFASQPAEPPRAYADPFAQTARPAPGYGEPQRFNAEPGMSSAAAHQALDALAQGLAASAAASSAPVEPVSPAIPLTPVFEAPEPEYRAQPVPSPSSSTLPAPLASPGSLPVNRTLEDAVADMLRPMLQQWVADNMPRIIERALRTEVAKSVKPGHKPPGM